jgi:hypothetical protein
MPQTETGQALESEQLADWDRAFICASAALHGEEIRANPKLPDACLGLFCACQNSGGELG